MAATQSVTILVRRWFERANGNTYFSASALVDGVPVEGIPFKYGYGSHGECCMRDKLVRDGHIAAPKGRTDDGRSNGACPSIHVRDELGLNYHCETVDVPREKDL